MEWLAELIAILALSRLAVHVLDSLGRTLRTDR